MRITSPFSFSLKVSPPIREAAILFGIPRLCAPVLGSEGQVSPCILLPALLDVCCYVRLRPLLVRLQGDQALFAQ